MLRRVKFKYLGMWFAVDEEADADVTLRIRRADAAIQQLEQMRR